MNPIKLFVLDIDGCLTMPFQTPDWKALSDIRSLHEASESDPTIPPLTLCTGRPLPYAESVAQWLGIRNPFVFESATLFKWNGNQIISGLPTLEQNNEKIQTASIQELYHSPLLKPILQMKEWLVTHLIPNYPGAVLEFTKLMDAGIVSDNTDDIREMHQKIIEHIDRYHRVEGRSLLEVHHTDISVNVLIKGNNKSMGLKLIEKETQIPIGEFAYIGDSSGDVPALRIAGRGFAPLNASDEVKKILDVTVLPVESTQAVLAAYHSIIEFNRSNKTKV